MKAVRYSMITMSLVLCFISVSCRNEDTVSEQFFDEDTVTVRLNLTTRGVETGDSDLLDELSSDPFQWFKTGTLFPQAPAQPRIALMIFNRDLNRYVYNQLLPFNSTGVDGQYQINIRIPKGETEFYALYAPNQTGKDLPYYAPEGNLQNKIPWDFLGAGTEEISKEEFAGAAFPAIIKEQQDGSLGLPVNNPYDGVTPSPADEKIIDWKGTSVVAWAQEITVPLFRDFARIRVYLASAPRYGQVTYNYQGISFLNFPVLMSPSFRENDSEKTQLAASTPGTGKAMEHTGTYSYGVKNEGAQLTVYEAPLTAEGEIDYVAMEARLYEQFVVPQYLAPYIPESNSWQKKQNHPKIQLTLDYFTGGDESQTKTRTFLLDVGEETSPGVYSGPIYPNRDYKVFIVLPESSDKEIIYRVEPWNSKEVDLPPFQ